MKKITIAVLGLGNRGRAYTSHMLDCPEQFDIVAIADISPDSVKLMQSLYGLENAQTYTDLDAFFAEKRADAIIISTPDRQHVPQAVRALRLGYDVLLEKPISDSREEIELLLKTQRETGGKVLVCHVLRYGPAYRKLDELLESGVIGRLYAIDASERVRYWHMAQAYVRGIAGTLENAHPTILAKCCHDLDLLQHYAGSQCDTVSSIGGLEFFIPENAPEGATKRCVDCPHKDTCPYSAKRIYVDNWHEAGEPAHQFPFYRVANVNPITEEALYEGLRTGPFGRCAFYCDSTNVDHQLVQMTFQNKVKASLKMVYGALPGRRISFYGTHGEIVLEEREKTITLMPYGGKEQVFDVRAASTAAKGHGGGDLGLVKTLYSMLTGETKQVTSLEESLESHLMGIAAEESRKADGKLVKVHQVL